MDGFRIFGRTRISACGSLTLGCLFLLAGCAESEPQPVSSKSSKFEVDGSSDKEVAVKPKSKSPTAESAADRGTSTDVAPEVPPPPQKPNRIPADQIDPSQKPPVASDNSNPPQDNVARDDNAPPTKPTKTLRLDPNKLPDGTPEELLAIIDQLERQRPRGTNEQEMVRDLVRMLQMRLAIADKVFQGQGTDVERLEAAQRKMRAFEDAIEVRLPNAAEGLLAFIQEISKDKSKGVARFGNMILFQLEMQAVVQGDEDAAKKTLVTLRETLEDGGATDDFFGPAQKAVNALQQGGFGKEATEAVRLVGDAYVKSDNPRIVEAAKQLQRFAKIRESGLPEALTALEKKEPESAEKVRDIVKKLLADNPGPELVSLVNQTSQMMEQMHHYKIAQELFDDALAAFQTTTSLKLSQRMELLKPLQEAAEAASRRLKLVGQPFTVEGNTLDGKSFDWSKYKGKVVLIDFWATWCGPCLEEMPNIMDNYNEYHERGFEVVGINLDEDREQLDKFFSTQSLPWSTVVSADAQATGFATPMAAQCGVKAIPFVILIGRDGKVLGLHVRGEQLGQRLAAIFGEGKAPGKDDAAPLKKDPFDPKEKPKTEGKTSRWQLPGRNAGGFVGADDKENKSPATPPASNNKAAADAPVAKAAEKKDEAVLPELQGNPYSPREDLSSLELVDFILNMQEKPKSIQARPGFADAIVEAADRVLTAKATSKPTEKQLLIATLAKCETLHKQASDGSADADKKLMEFVATLKDDARPKVAAEVRFLLMERQVIDAEKGPLEKVTEVLAELKQYCEKEKMGVRHLRMASAAVQAVNRLTDGDEREKQFGELGTLFAKSENKELARYGKKLKQKPEQSDSELVGKPLELEGTTVDGQAFDWKAYRGKVVLVDFWATWCGPCLREMPNVHKLHEKFHKQGFEVVGISIDADPEALTTFLEQNEIPWKTIAGEGAQALATKYGVRGIPTMMLVDRDGKVLGVSHSSGEFEKKIEKLLSGEAK